MNIAIIFAGGVGRRMGNKALPKQFLKLHSKEIIIYTLEHFEYHPNVDGIVVACVEEWIPYLEGLIHHYQIGKAIDVVPGGNTGQQSIFNGLLAAEKRYGDDGIVLVHDGVRPLIDEKTITSCIDSVKQYGSAITVAPAVETIVKVGNGQEIVGIIDRSECQLARAPQAFYLKELIKAHRRALEDGGIEFIDSATMMQNYGHKLYTVQGPVENIKITTPMDYYTFRALYEVKENTQLFGI